MSKNLLIMFMILVCGSVVLAQDDYHKIEVSGGYSFERTKGFPGDAILGTASGNTSGTTGTDGSRRRSCERPPAPKPSAPAR